MVHGALLLAAAGCLSPELLIKHACLPACMACMHVKGDLFIVFVREHAANTAVISQTNAISVKWESWKDKEDQAPSPFDTDGIYQITPTSPSSSSHNLTPTTTTGQPTSLLQNTIFYFLQLTDKVTDVTEFHKFTLLLAHPAAV